MSAEASPEHSTPMPDHAASFIQEFSALAEALRGQFVVERDRYIDG